MSTGRTRFLDSQFAGWARFISQLIAIPVVAFLALTLRSMDQDLTRLKIIADSNTQASVSAAAEVVRLWQSISQLQITIATLPPRDFRDRVDRLEERIRDIELKTARRGG